MIEMMERWFLVCSNPGSERRAERFLSGANFGYTVYYPQIEHRYVVRGRFVDQIRPFLPPYMFVRDDRQGTARIKSAPGVASVVRSGGRAVTVASNVIQMLKARENDRGLICIDDSPGAGLQCGGEIVVEDDYGFTEWTGLFQHMSGVARAVVFLRALSGGMVRTTVNVARLRPA
jgi:transcriptional antiterminator RfaH